MTRRLQNRRFRLCRRGRGTIGNSPRMPARHYSSRPPWNWSRAGRLRRLRSASPAFTDAGDQNVDLLISQRTAGALRGRRHRSAGDSAGNHAMHRSVVDDREIDVIVHRDCGAGFAVGAVASRAILAVERREVSDVCGAQRQVGLRGTAGQRIAPGEQDCG